MPGGGLIVAQTFPLTSGAHFFGGTPTVRAEFGLGKGKWKILDCDSQDGLEGEPRKAIDDDSSTFWHTRYRDKVDPMPHHISVDLGETVAIRGFTYTPRQDQWDGGIITGLDLRSARTERTGRSRRTMWISPISSTAGSSRW